MAAETAALHNADWSDVLSNIDPFAFAGIGSSMALTLCVLGAAWLVHLFRHESKRIHFAEDLGPGSDVAAVGATMSGGWPPAAQLGFSSLWAATRPNDLH